MKKLALLALCLSLAACSPNGGSNFDVAASVSGAEIDVTIKRIYDKETKAFKGTDVNFVYKQPQVTFLTKAGSVGGTVTKATVSVTDSSGNLYNDVNGKYTQSFVARILPGWACTTPEGAADPSADPATCSFTDKVAVTRSQVFPDEASNASVQLLIPSVGEQASDDCVEGPCPANLSLNITFTVQDDLGNIHTISTNKSPVLVNRVSDTTVEE